MSDVEPQAVTKFIQLPTGSKLYTERWHLASADQPSQTLICIHGLGASSGIFHPSFKPLLSLLPSAHILAYDRAGSGLSPLPDYGDTPLSLSHMLAELDALVASEVPTGPIVLVAHSAGTVLAARWLLTLSPALERVTHVIFLGGPIDVPAPPEQSEMRLRMAIILETAGPTATTDGALPLLLGKTSMSQRPLAVALLRAITISQDGAAFAAAVRAFDRDISSEGKTIDWEAIQKRFKVLAICGDEDVLVSASDVARYLDRSPVRTLSGVGQ